MNLIIYYIDSARLNRPWNIDKGDALSGTDQTILSVALGCAARGFPVVLMCTRLPSEVSVLPLQVKFAESLRDAINQARALKAAYFVFPATSEDEQLAILRDHQVGVPLIGWAHNSPSFAWLCAADANPNLKSIVAVSDGQAASMAIYHAFRKVIAIPNIVDFVGREIAPVIAQQMHFKITYVGALTPSKGFHWLAEVWPRIYANYPSAKLVVCGSSGLYGKSDAVPGLNGLANRDYEEQFLGFLGGSLQSARDLNVVFQGSISKERLKAEILESAFVVVNPNWRDSTETFCMSAVESLVLGRAVIGGRAGALPETVGHDRGGLLSASVFELEQNICRLIENQELRARLAVAGQLWALHYYSRNAVIERWCVFFEEKNITKFYSDEKSAFPSLYAFRRFIGWILPSWCLGLLKRLKAKVRL